MRANASGESSKSKSSKFSRMRLAPTDFGKTIAVLDVPAEPTCAGVLFDLARPPRR